jgi:hypothetical protein
MTQPPHVTTEVLSEPADPPRQRRRRLVLLIATVAAVALVTGAVMSWHRVAAHRAEQVEVMWTGIPKCTGADVVAYSRPVGPGWSGPLIKARRGMRCIITVEVRNHSGGSVHLDHALLPLMGPQGGAVIKVDTTTDPDLWSASPPDDIDVMRLLDTTLSPGGTTTFDIPLVFRESGCSGGPHGGGYAFAYGFPTITFTSLTLSFDRPALNDFAHTQVSPSRGCVRIGSSY